MLTSLLSLGLAAAVEPAVEALPAGTFEIRVGAVTTSVEAIAFPPATPGAGRVCAFVIAADPGGVTLRRHPTCPEALAADVDAALAGWKVSANGVTAPIDIAELWWVYPVAAGGPVRLFVRPQAERDVIVRTLRADVLPWALTAQVPLEFPDAARGTDTSSNTCLARVGVDPTGFPEAVEVSGCDAVFADALREGLSRWRFGGGGTLDGEPFRSGLTLRVRYGTGPSGDDVEVELPEPANRGDRPASIAAPAPFTPKPPPSGRPLFSLDHKSFAEVRIHEMVLPAVEPVGTERRCDLLVQVNSVRRVWAWSETCDPTVRRAAEEAAAEWSLVPGTVERGERLARFRVTFVFPAGAESPEVWIPADDLVDGRVPLPENVHTHRAARAIVTVPPKLPRTRDERPAGEVVCEYAVTVGTDGRPRDIRSVDGAACPEVVSGPARKAVNKWRWVPAESDGRPVESDVVARLRLGGS